MNEQAWKEQAARIIDPSSWAVMDGYLKQMLRKYKGQNIGYDPDAFKHKESMAIAEALWPLVQQAIAAEGERYASNLQKTQIAPPAPTEAQIRADERERCAKVAEGQAPVASNHAAYTIAAAIRSLKESDNGAG